MCFDFFSNDFRVNSRIYGIIFEIIFIVSVKRMIRWVMVLKIGLEEYKFVGVILVVKYKVFFSFELFEWKYVDYNWKGLYLYLNKREYF